MERQTVVRSAAIALVGIAGSVLFVQRYILPDPARDLQVSSPAQTAGAPVVMGGVLNVPDKTRAPRTNGSNDMAALDLTLGDTIGASREKDSRPGSFLTDPVAGQMVERASPADRLALDPVNTESASANAMTSPVAPATGQEFLPIGDDEFFVSSAAPSSDTNTTILTPSDSVVLPTEDAALPGCAATLSLEADIDALVKLDVFAPCHTNERVVISHLDLAFTAMTDASGSLSLYVPAFSAMASFDVLLPDNTHLRDTVQVADAADHMRVTVQWSGAQPLGLNAFHGDAEFGDAGHLHVSNPFDPALDAAFLIALGDAQMPEPMLAQVYSIPSAEANRARLELEVSVNAATCGKDILAHVLHTGPGLDAKLRDLQVAMPGCNAPEGFVTVPLSLPRAADQLAQN